MRVLIATIQVPFVRGDAEMHAAGLQRALMAAGHQAELVALPFTAHPPDRIADQILAARLFDLTESSGTPIDRVIGLRFPAYLIPHPNKVLWILHQYRPAYDLWGGERGDLMHAPDGQEVRAAIHAADPAFIPEARAVYAASRHVASRLQRFNGIEAEPLYHPPPGAALFRSAPAEDFLFVPSRINRASRHLLIVEALAQCRQPVRLRLAGPADDTDCRSEIGDRIRALGLADRIEWQDVAGDDARRDLYARCLGVIFPPIDEDLGYVTLEAMLAAKPVITCTDSGGPVEFVRDGETGLVAAPTAEGLAAAMDRLWSDRASAARWGEAGRALYERQDITWERVVTTLTRDA